jgi:hypothetical protein
MNMTRGAAGTFVITIRHQLLELLRISIVVENEVVTNGLWQHSREIIVFQSQFVELGQRGQFTWNLSLEEVMIEIQVLQGHHARKHGRRRSNIHILRVPRQLIVLQMQLLEGMSQPTQRDGQRAHEAIVIEAKFCIEGYYDRHFQSHREWCRPTECYGPIAHPPVSYCQTARGEYFPATDFLTRIRILCQEAFVIVIVIVCGNKEKGGRGWLLVSIQQVANSKQTTYNEERYNSSDHTHTHTPNHHELRIIHAFV